MPLLRIQRQPIEQNCKEMIQNVECDETVNMTILGRGSAIILVNTAGTNISDKNNDGY